MINSFKPARERPIPEALRRGRSHTAAEKTRLVAEVLGAYLRTQKWLHTLGVEEAVLRARALGGDTTARETTEEAQFYGRRLGRIVVRTLTPLPTDSRCLARSLVLTAILARRGVAATLVIGVASEPHFRAHAWVEYEGVPLLPTGGKTFSRLVEI